MFKLSALKGPQAAVKLGEAAVPDEEDAAAEPESSGDEEDAEASDVDSDEAQRWGFPLSYIPESASDPKWLRHASSGAELCSPFLVCRACFCAVL